MSEDKYASLRSMPFDAVARAIGIDVSKFRLRKGGTEWAGNCPMHQPKKNGTAFSYANDGRWHCFSCNAKGRGAIDLAMAVRNCGFQEAVNVLQPHSYERAPAAAASPSPRVVQEVPAENAPFKGTYEKFKAESAWLKERGLEAATLDRYGVFEYRNDSRRSAYNGSVMLKIARWSDGECVGYLSRNVAEATPEKPKYRFPEGLHKSLEVFGAWQLKADGRLPLRIVYLVESPFAVMKLHQLGLPAVSPFGWSVSDRQAEIIAEVAKGAVCLPDRDKAEAFSPYAHLLSKRMWVRCPAMPEGVEDPESLGLEQIKALT